MCIRDSYYSNCLAIMYNKDIFDEMGLEYPDSGWTWDDFKDMTAKTTTADHYGLTMSLIKSEEGTFDVLPFIWQAGADYDSLDSEGAREALTMILSLIHILPWSRKSLVVLAPMG